MAYKQNPARGKHNLYSAFQKKGLIRSKAEREADRDARKGKKFLTTQYDSPGSSETFNTTPAEDSLSLIHI